MAAAAVDLKNQLMKEEMEMVDEVISESNGSTSQGSIKGPDEQVSSTNFDFWSNHTGMKIKQFSDEELLAFRKPFQLGWKREVVLRGTVTNSGRKIGDVYYFSPDKKIKLRSYVEMGIFLKKNTQCGLEPEHFTFARQPIYEPPAEIVRPAQTRGSNQPAEPDTAIAVAAPITPAPAPITFATPREVINQREKDRSASSSSSFATTPDDGSSLVEGRAKRKRVAPTRFEDEDFAEQSPIKKKPLIVKVEKPPSSLLTSQVTPPIKISIKPPTCSGGAKTPIIVTPIVTQPPKTQPALQSQVTAPKEKPEIITVTKVPIVKTEVVKYDPPKLPDTTEPKTVIGNGNKEHQNENKKEGDKSVVVNPVAPVAVVSQPQPAVKKPTPKPSLLEKNLTRQFKPIKPKPMPVEVVPVPMEDFAEDGKSMIPPCSIMCGGHGRLPSLLCSRCLCLFHPSCVPRGIYLNEPNDFVCPNCIQPSDKGSVVKISNGKIEEDHHLETSSYSDSSPVPLKVCSSSRNSSRAPSPSTFSSVLNSRLSQPRNSSKPTPEERFLAQLKLLRSFQQQTSRKVQQTFPAKPTGDLLRDTLIGSSTPMNNRKQHIIKSRGGHLQIDHPMFKQEPVRTKSVLPPGLLSKGQHLQMSKIIHNQLQAFYQPTPIAPIAPIRVTPAQIASILDQKTRNKYREYLNKNYPGINRLVDGYSFLNSVVEYLTTKDLISLSKVNRSFRSLTSQPQLWKRLLLKGVIVKDWKALGEKILQCRCTEIDFDGLRILTGTDLSNYWRQFSALIPFLETVPKLKFGSVPKLVLEELSRSQIKFKSVSIKNIFDESTLKKEVNLSILNNFSCMSSLEEIQVSCKSGLIADESTPESICQIFSHILTLNSLSLTNMKGLKSEHFRFLEDLTNLTSLEIGSCESWNDSPVSEDGVTIPFKYFQNLVRLQHLKLIELIIDESSGDLPVVMHHMKQLKSLSLESVTMSPGSQEILDMLAQTINNDLDEMKSLSLSTDDPTSNRLVTDFVKKLENLDHLVWKVGTFVEDSGECVIPLSKERTESDLDEEMDLTNGDENHETIDVDSLTELLDAHLPRTKVEILPQ